MLFFRTSPLLDISTSRLERSRFLSRMGIALKEKPGREKQISPLIEGPSCPSTVAKRSTKSDLLRKCRRSRLFRDLQKGSLFFLEGWPYVDSVVQGGGSTSFPQQRRSQLQQGRGEKFFLHSSFPFGFFLSLDSHPSPEPPAGAKLPSQGL